MNFLKPIGAVLLFIALIMIQGCSEPKTDRTEELTTYHIYCDSTDFQSLYSDWENSFYIPVKLVVDGKTYPNLKMRLRGDTSRELPKKSLKIKPDGSLIPDGKPCINLNAEYTDKSMIRQALSSNLFQRSGHPCFNTNYAKVYLNDEFLGLYLEVENMDEHFLRRNGFDPDGNLYKATNDGACMSIHDDVAADWENKTKKKREFSDLEQLIKEIHNTPDEDFHSFVYRTFDYNSLINILSMNMYIANGSTYYHNYHLFHDLKESGKWYMFPWDLDKTISYYHWKPYVFHHTSSYWESDNPLVERCLLNDRILSDIKSRLEELSNDILNEEVVGHLIDSLKQRIEPVLMQDTTNQITDRRAWNDQVEKELDFMANHNDQLLGQMKNYPSSFKLNRIDHLVSDSVRFTWDHSRSHRGKDITYTLRYGEHHLLPDSVSVLIENLTENEHVVRGLKPGKKYYWRVSASDGELETDGFNTKNIFHTRRAKVLSGEITKDLELSAEGGPYVVKGRLSVARNATLSASPGTELLLDSDGEIYVEGGLAFEGSAESPIKMFPILPGDEWGDITINNPADTILLRFVNIREGRLSANDATLRIENCDWLIDNKKLTITKGEEVLRFSWIWTRKCNLIFTGNTLRGNNSGEGLNLFHTECSVTNNELSYLPDAIELISCKNSEVAYNKVSHGSDDGIDMNNCNNVAIHHNQMFNIKDKGISIGAEQYGFSEDVKAFHNLVYGARDGVGLKDSSFADIHDNFFGKCHTGIRLYLKEGVFNYGGTAESDDNIFFQCEHTATADEHSVLSGNIGFELNDDCELKDFPHGDYIVPMKCLPKEISGASMNWLDQLNQPEIVVADYDKYCGLMFNNKNAYPLFVGGYSVIQNEKTIYTFPDIYLLPAHSQVLVGKCKKNHIPENAIYIHNPDVCRDDMDNLSLVGNTSLY